jgi:hypothetical protein
MLRAAAAVGPRELRETVATRVALPVALVNCYLLGMRSDDGALTLDGDMRVTRS